MTVVAARLLAELKVELKALEGDLRERCEAHPDLDASFRAEWDAARAAGRTAFGYPAWRDGQLTQVGVGWVLACTFVRFCEDNDLVDVALLGGPGERRARAAEQRAAFYGANPGAGAREWLEHVLGRAAALPGMREVLGEHNPVWRFGPTADGAQRLIAFWERLDPDRGDVVHDFTDPALSTRFLGDLYQDLSEAARKTFALLQTPEFVERFILERTLVPALATFGVERTDVIDPTCGSGHFLLGAFELLLPRWEVWHADHEPGAPRAVVVQRVLDQVAGVDLNPFAVAITKFRLLVAAARAAGVGRLAGLWNFELRVAVGDALLSRPMQLTLDGIGDERVEAALAHAGAFDDRALALDLLARPWAAVVGNPPYVTVKDPAVNDLYRKLWGTCHRQYSLGVPFTERFWALAIEDRERPGFVGMITANSFMKREFGRKLVEDWVPTHDVTHVLDTSGAYIPGHGTPTVILFGRNRRPAASTVRMVMGIRGEPARPALPEKGLVWSSITGMVDEPGTQNEYVSIVDLERARLSSHPWSIGGGGAAELKGLLDQVAAKTLDDAIAVVGFGAVTREDDVFRIGVGPAQRAGVPAAQIRPLGAGEEIRDWGSERFGSIWPYNEGTLEAFASEETIRFLWPWRRQLSGRNAYGLTQIERGLHWWEYSMFFRERYRTPLSIVFAFVATHNHFVLDRGGKVFNRTAPVIKLPAGATEDDHLALVGVLNSSPACLWMQQVFHNKGAGGGKRVEAGFSARGGEEWENHYELDGTKLKAFPLPAGSALEHARELDRLARHLATVTPDAIAAGGTPTVERLAAARIEWFATRARMIAVQEELDWHVAHLYGLTDTPLTVPLDTVPPLALGERAFEIVLARKLRDGDEDSSWFTRHGSTPIVDVPDHWPAPYRHLVEQRIEAIESDLNIGLIEKPEHKRRWATTAWDDQVTVAVRTWLLDRLEDPRRWPDATLRTCAELADTIRTDPDALTVVAQYAGPGADLTRVVTDLVAAEAVPFHAAHRYSPDGQRIRAQWETTWDLQRREDRGEPVGPIPVPPKYGRTDFAKPTYWTLRGKLDVPKERFISHPGLTRPNDPSPVVGWAGWDHAERARALAAWYFAAQADGVEPARLLPVLAGLQELVAWLLQWHDERDPATGERFGTFVAEFVRTEAASLGVTPDDLATRLTPDTAARTRRKAHP